MARKPNYQFERHERDRAKAAKIAEKAAARERQRSAAAQADVTAPRLPPEDER